MKAVLIVASLIYFFVNYLVLNKIDEVVKEPYMDEIFHVPQAQQYCVGNYTEWNDKITTLPGLYLVSTSFIRKFTIITGQTDDLKLCSTYYLRLSNVVMATLNFIVILEILMFFATEVKAKQDNKEASKTHPVSVPLVTNAQSSLILLNALALSLFPLNHFFQYLFYTDVGSTFFVLAAYYHQLKANYKFSFIFGAIAVLYRQTNIIWVVFCMFQLMLSNAKHLVKNQEAKKLIRQNAETGFYRTERNRIFLLLYLFLFYDLGEFALSQRTVKKPSNVFELIMRTPTEAFTNFELVKFAKKLYKEDFWGKKLIYQDLIQAFYSTQFYLFIVKMFIVFVVVNNGIVVGDRTNHKATFHLVQIFYFLGFSMFFSLSTFVFNYKTVKGLTQFIGKNYKVILAVLLPVCCLIVKNFSFEHRFLLADNRHFTFYIWSKFMRKYEFARYVVVPFYVAAAYLFYRNLVSNGKSLGWLIAYFVCTLTCLVPQELIEFRYFILPYFIYRLNIVKLGWLEATFEVAFNALINFLTIYVFLNKTFVWTDSPEQLQRFMW